MNRKKALFFREFRTMRWFLLAGVLCAVGMCVLLHYYLMNTLDDFQNFDDITMGAMSNSLEYGAIFSHYLIQILAKAGIVALIAFAFMSIMQFADGKSQRKREFMMSLPYSQNEKFLVSAFCGYGVITASCVVLSIGTLIVRSQIMPILLKRNIVLANFSQVCSNETLFHTVRTLVYFWLILMALYSIFMLAHSLIGHGVLAGLVGLGVAVAPLELTICGTMLMEQLGMAWEDMYELWIQRERYSGIFCGMSFGEPIQRHEGSIYVTYISYSHIWFLFGVLIAIFLICTLLAWYVEKKRDLARTGSLVPLRLARIGLGLGAGVCFGVAAAFIVYAYTPLQDVRYSVPMAIVVTIVVFLSAQKLLKRIVK